jgi:hypothetical protein
MLHILVNSGLIKVKRKNKPENLTKKLNNSTEFKLFNLKDETSNKLTLGKSTDYKTELYLSIFNLNDLTITQTNLKIFFDKQQIYKHQKFYFSKNEHYLTVQPLIHNNKRSKEASILKNLDFINLRSSMKLFLD